MLKLEVYDACSSEIDEELFYASADTMRADFPRIEEDYSKRYSYGERKIAATVNLKDYRGEISLYREDGTKYREDLYLILKNITVR